LTKPAPPAYNIEIMADNDIQLDPPSALPGDRATVASQARTRVSYTHLNAFAVIAFLTTLVFIGVLVVQYLNHQFYIDNSMWPSGGSGFP
jgi:hypothetical protein